MFALILFVCRVEEDLRLLGDITDGEGTARRGSTSARRSFFRRKKHTRSSSRDSKEVASFSNTQLSWFSDSGMLSEEGTIPSYQRVERLDCKFTSQIKFETFFFLILRFCCRFCLPSGIDIRTVVRMCCRKDVDRFPTVFSALHDDSNELYFSGHGKRSRKQHFY